MKSNFSETEQNQIRDAVTAAEKRCGGQIVPMVVCASDEYREVNWRIGFFFSFILIVFSLWFLPHVDPLWIICLQVVFLSIGYGLGFIPPLRRFFLDPLKAQEEVRQRAIQCFYEQGVHRTKERIGILIFISLLEHRVEVLCDEGIAQKVPQDTWNALVMELTGGIRSGQLTTALTKAIESAGSLVAKCFPHDPRNGNELPDSIVER